MFPGEADGRSSSRRGGGLPGCGFRPRFSSYHVYPSRLLALADHLGSHPALAFLPSLLPRPRISANNAKDGDGSSIHAHICQIARLTILAMKTFHANKSILNRGCLVLRNLSITPAFVRVLARTPGCVEMLLHCRRACPRDALIQRSARTVAILMQRSTAEKDGVGGGGGRAGGPAGGGFGLARHPSPSTETSDFGQSSPSSPPPPAATTLEGSKL